MVPGSPNSAVDSLGLDSYCGTSTPCGKSRDPEGEGYREGDDDPNLHVQESHGIGELPSPIHRDLANPCDNAPEVCYSVGQPSADIERLADECKADGDNSDACKQLNQMDVDQTVTAVATPEPVKTVEHPGTDPYGINANTFLNQSLPFVDPMLDTSMGPATDPVYFWYYVDWQNLRARSLQAFVDSLHGRCECIFVRAQEGVPFVIREPEPENPDQVGHFSTYNDMRGDPDWLFIESILVTGDNPEVMDSCACAFALAGAPDPTPPPPQPLESIAQPFDIPPEH